MSGAGRSLEPSSKDAMNPQDTYCRESQCCREGDFTGCECCNLIRSSTRRAVGASLSKVYIQKESLLNLLAPPDFRLSKTNKEVTVSRTGFPKILFQQVPEAPRSQTERGHQALAQCLEHNSFFSLALIANQIQTTPNTKTFCRRGGTSDFHREACQHFPMDRPQILCPSVLLQRLVGAAVLFSWTFLLVLQAPHPT